MLLLYILFKNIIVVNAIYVWIFLSYFSALQQCVFKFAVNSPLNHTCDVREYFITRRLGVLSLYIYIYIRIILTKQKWRRNNAYKTTNLSTVPGTRFG